MIQTIRRLFLLWVLIAALVAAWHPEPFAVLEPLIPALLGVVMLAVGLTLQPRDFARLARRPGQVGLLLGAQWLIMAPLAWLLGVALGLPAAVTAGLVLVGAAPGGTASNVITGLARGDVALSVSVTAVSTILAPVLMPAWVLLLLGEQITVGLVELFGSIAAIVLLPVVAGIVLRRVLERCAPSLAATAIAAGPAFAAIVVAVIVGVVVALNLDVLEEAAWPTFSAVALHNALGLAAGLLVGYMAGMGAAQRRAGAFEVGMQNSGLAVALALAFFSPEAALAGALFSVWHNITGAALATWFQRIPVAEAENDMNQA